jgi:membrane associated rhomboid family serine protease
MLPIRDTIQSRNYPVVNTAIIGINIVVYLLQLTQGSDLERFIYYYGLVPARYTVPHVSDYFSLPLQIFSLFSYMFLHGGFIHLIGNMWSLYIFGDNVEDRLGPLRYLVFYGLCGFTSGLSHMVLNQYSNVPTICASGAIAGVMGAYFILYPRAKILTLIPIIIIPWFVELPAFIFLGVWFFLQMMSAAGAHGGGIAWWAHIGGFIFGIVFLKLFQAWPQLGATSQLQRATRKKTSHRFQVIRPQIRGDDPHLYGTISITYYEALTGVRKLVDIPWGFHSRMFNVSIPSGTQAGRKLRLRGLGKQTDSGQRGDLLLTVVVQK